jgi:hypothetical protein
LVDKDDMEGGMEEDTYAKEVKREEFLVFEFGWILGNE